MNSDELLQRASEAYAIGDVAEAIGLCRTLLISEPRNPSALFLLGLAIGKSGRLRMGEQYVHLAVSMDPSIKDGHPVLGQLNRAIDKSRQNAYVRHYFLQVSAHMDYPRNVAIETSGRCNATCPFCPQGNLERRGTTMSDELFEKVVNDLEQIPRGRTFTIFPNFINEPFMDKKIFQRLEMLNTRLPNASLYFFTNFNVLPKGFFESFAKVRHISGINVSFNAAEPEEYERRMGVDFSRTVEHLNSLFALNRKKDIYAQPVILSRVESRDEGDKAYRELCCALFPDFEEGRDFVAHVKNASDFLGATGNELTPVPHSVPCGAWLDMNVSCTGVVPHCCMDAELRFAIGDVNEMSLLDIYNSPAWRNLRENAIAREGIYPCNTCSLLQ